MQVNIRLSFPENPNKFLLIFWNRMAKNFRASADAFAVAAAWEPGKSQVSPQFQAMGQHVSMIMTGETWWIVKGRASFCCSPWFCRKSHGKLGLTVAMADPLFISVEEEMGGDCYVSKETRLKGGEKIRNKRSAPTLCLPPILFQVNTWPADELCSIIISGTKGQRKTLINKLHI